MNVDVLHIITGLDVGGAERSLTNLLSAGLSNDLQHGVISLQDRGAFGRDIDAANVPLWTLGMTRGAPSLTALMKLRSMVASANPKLLQGWMYHSNLAAAITRTISPGTTKLAWNIRQTVDRLAQEKPLTRWIIRAHRPFAANVDAIIYNCESSRQQHERLGMVGKHSTVIANGVDTDKFQPSPEFHQSLRQQLRIPEAATVIGHAARYHPMKDHASLLSAMTSVARTNPEVHFVLAGTGLDRQNQALVKHAAAIGEQRCHLLGERDDMHRVFASMDFFCSSSAWGEGFPNVIAEAMACGVPCVATDVGASAQIVGKAGTVVPTNAPHELATALIGLLQLPCEARQHLGAAARQRVLDNYTIDAAVSRYRALYARLLEG